MVNRRRAVGAVAVGLVGSMGLAGCSGVISACPAIGYSHALTVTLDGEQVETVARVQLCRDGRCEPAQGTDTTNPTPLVAMWHQDDDTRTFTLLSAPAQITVRTLADDGTVLADTDVTPQWVRVGGSARCGGPHEATVTVQA